MELSNELSRQRISETSCGVQSVTPEGFDAQAVAQYWFAEAEETLMVADHLVERGDYSYALFFGHLAVEKELKGLHAIRRGSTLRPFTILSGWRKQQKSRRTRR